MENKYKQMIVNTLYGLIEGSPDSVIRSLKRRWERNSNLKPYDDLSITHTNRFIEESENERSVGCWIGSMTVTLEMEGETFSVTRDWGKEYEIDSKYPEYHSDLYFYEKDISEGYRIWAEWKEKNKE